MYALGHRLTIFRKGIIMFLYLRYENSLHVYVKKHECHYCRKQIIGREGEGAWSTTKFLFLTPFHMPMFFVYHNILVPLPMTLFAKVIYCNCLWYDVIMPIFCISKRNYCAFSFCVITPLKGITMYFARYQLFFASTYYITYMLS